MRVKWKIILIILMLLMSALHTHVFPPPLVMDWDINIAMNMLGAISFVVSFLVVRILGERLLLTLFRLPLVLALLFCFFEILTEFLPSTHSKGFGWMYFLICYTCSFIGTVGGLLMGWFLTGNRKRVEKKANDN